MNTRQCIITYRIKDKDFQDAVAYYGNLILPETKAQFYPLNSDISTADYAVFMVFKSVSDGKLHQCQVRVERVNKDSKKNNLAIYWGTGYKDKDNEAVGNDYDRKLLKNHKPDSNDEPLRNDPVEERHEFVAGKIGSVVDPFGNQTGFTINPLWPKRQVNAKLWSLPAAAVVAVVLTGFFAAFGLFSKRNR